MLLAVVLLSNPCLAGSDRSLGYQLQLCWVESLAGSWTTFGATDCLFGAYGWMDGLGPLLRLKFSTKTLFDCIFGFWGYL